eukprot:TRINITY_DN87053_c0_g1_i1.p1 TRINITY_DN87053_c0_g1~~TRINITY_DN87053_c0_g1_i1.p1  ORF type:complete len:320 (+),score=13.19 TRINITY_DN87053_c0_g1_i1:437-1396(+)
MAQGMLLGEEWIITKPYMFLLVTAAMTPGCLARSLSSLKSVNNFCFLSFVYVAVTVVTKALMLRAVVQPTKPDDDYNNNSPLIGFALALPITCTAMNAHLSIPQVYSELSWKTKQRAKELVGVSCILGFIFYLFAGQVVYVMFSVATKAGIHYTCAIPFTVFGFSTESNIIAQLTSLHSEQDSFVSLAKALLGVSIVLKTAMLQVPLRTIIASILWSKEGPDTLLSISFNNNVCITIASLLAAYLFAVSVPRIDLMIQLIGATSAVGLVYVLPGVFSLRLDRRSTFITQLRGWTLIACGSLISVSSLGVVISTECGYIN